VRNLKSYGAPEEKAKERREDSSFDERSPKRGSRDLASRAPQKKGLSKRYLTRPAKDVPGRTRRNRRMAVPRNQKKGRHKNLEKASLQEKGGGLDDAAQNREDHEFQEI